MDFLNHPSSNSSNKTHSISIDMSHHVVFLTLIRRLSPESSHSTSCSICGADLLDDILEGAVSGLASQPKRTECGQMICELCISDQMRDNRFEPQLRMFQNDSSAPATPIPDSDATPIIESMSTKIKALVADLYKHNDIEKRYTPLLSLK